MNDSTIPRSSIVVGVDGSEASGRALDWASAQTRHEGRSLVLARAIPSRADTRLDVDGHDRRRGPGGRRLQEAELLDEARERAQGHVPGLDVHEVLRVTEPRSLLTVLGKDALMVVVGARGLGAAREGLLGSVGRSLTRHPPCPVVVHRTPADETLPEVLVGFDGSARSTPVLELAFRLADQRELALRLLHCSRQTPTVTPGAWASARPVAPDAEKRAVAERVAALIEKYPDVRAVADIEWGDPEALLVAASGQRAMVVLGAHHPGHAGPLPASVTTTVLERARCPVAVVPL